MVTSVPAWFNSKASGLIPPGFDITFAVDTNISASSFAAGVVDQFVTNLCFSLRDEGTGLNPETPNRVSYIISENSPGENIEKFVTVDGVSERWLMADRVLEGATGITYPSFQQQESFNGKMGTAVNRITTDTDLANSRDYNLLCEQVIIAGKGIVNPDDQVFALDPKYPYRYVGCHDVNLLVRESDDLPPGPPLDPTYPYLPYSFIYTTPEVGVAVYEQRIGDFTPVVNLFYRENMPTSAFNLSGLDPKFREAVVNTNGAIFNFNNLNSRLDFITLGEVLGKILYRYFYIPSS